MTEIKITRCPPGVALGAGDLDRWAHNRQLGRTSVAGQRGKDLKAWARNPHNVSSNGHALTPRQIRERRKAKQRQARRAERRTGRAIERSDLVLWGDKWSDAPDAPSDIADDERPPWE